MRNMYDNFKYLWCAEFADGHLVAQHPDDLYSKHNPKNAWNPSSFRDFLEYAEQHPNNPLKKFTLGNKEIHYTVDFSNPKRPIIMYDETNRWGVPTKHHEWYRCKRDLTNVRPIYYREMEMDMLTGKKRCNAFVIGFQGNESNGNNYQKTMNVV